MKSLAEYHDDEWERRYVQQVNERLGKAVFWLVIVAFALFIGIIVVKDQKIQELEIQIRALQQKQPPTNGKPTQPPA